MSDATVEPRVPLNGVTQLLLPELGLAFFMAVRLPRPVKLALSTLLLGGILHTFMTATSGLKVNDYAIGSAVLGNTFFSIILFIWMSDPMKEFRYLRDQDPSSLVERSLFQRFYNSLCIVRNYRLVGWNVQTPNVPPAFKGSRTQFLLRRFRQFLWSVVLTDITESFIYPYFHFYIPGPSDPALRTGVVGFLFRSWCLLAWLTMTYAILKLSYELASLVAVGLGLSRPEDWPDCFGNWSDAYTLRRLWGRTWHQNLRRHFSHWGRLVVRTLHIPRGTWLSSQTQLHTAFLLSAIIHSFGDLMLGRHNFGRSFPYFIVNALAITFEDSVIAFCKSLGFAVSGGRPTVVAKVVGYVWVVLFIRFSAPLYVDWMFESGVTATPVLSFSPTRTWILPYIQNALGSAPTS